VAVIINPTTNSTAAAAPPKIRIVEGPIIDLCYPTCRV
jgi:hypothetical protein